MSIFLFYLFLLSVSANTFISTTSNAFTDPNNWSKHHIPYPNETAIINNHSVTLDSPSIQHVNKISMYPANFVVLSPLRVNQSITAIQSTISIQSSIEWNIFFMEGTQIWLFNGVKIKSKKPFLIYDDNILFLASNKGAIVVNGTLINTSKLYVYSGAITRVDRFIQSLTGETIFVPSTALVPTLIYGDTMNISGKINVFASQPLHYCTPLFSANSIVFNATLECAIPFKLYVYSNKVMICFE